jgi:hypothetical protein
MTKQNIYIIITLNRMLKNAMNSLGISLNALIF